MIYRAGGVSVRISGVKKEWRTTVDDSWTGWDVSEEQEESRGGRTDSQGR